MFWSDRVQVGWLNADQARLTWQHGARRCWPVDRRRRSWCWPVQSSWTSPAGPWTWARSASGSHLAATWVRIKDKNHPSQHSWKQDCSNATEPIPMSVCLKKSLPEPIIKIFFQPKFTLHWNSRLEIAWELSRDLYQPIRTVKTQHSVNLLRNFLYRIGSSGPVTHAIKVLQLRIRLDFAMPKFLTWNFRIHFVS